LGQRIAQWEVEDKKSIQIPVPHISQGTYLVKVKTSNGVVSKKIMVY